MFPEEILAIMLRQTDNLKMHCIPTVKYDITASNVVFAYKLAVEEKNEKLANYCLSFIWKNFEEEEAVIREREEEAVIRGREEEAVIRESSEELYKIWAQKIFEDYLTQFVEGITYDDLNSAIDHYRTSNLNTEIPKNHPKNLFENLFQ